MSGEFVKGFDNDEELGRYEEEIAACQRILDWLMRKGMVYEQGMPRKMIQSAMDRRRTQKAEA